MTVCRQSDAERDLGPYFPLFREALGNAVAWFWANHAADAHWMESRTRANMIRDRAANVELPQLLVGHPVKEKLHNQIKLFVFEAGRKIYSIKIKQMDELGTVATGKSQLSIDYNDNQLDLPGIPSKTTALHLGHVHNIARRDDPEILLVCAHGEEPAWVINLSDIAPPKVAELPRSMPPDDGGTRVRVKKPAREKTSS